MKLYVYRPEGHGSLTFMVMAETEEAAFKAVMQVAKDECRDYEAGYLKDSGTKPEIYEELEVAVNYND